MERSLSRASIHQAGTSSTQINAGMKPMIFLLFELFRIVQNKLLKHNVKMPFSSLKISFLTPLVLLVKEK